MSGRRWAPWISHALALCLFSIAALWCSRGVLSHPATVVTYQPHRDLGALTGSDLRRGITQLAYASRKLSTAPRGAFAGPMCYPSGDSVAFGEHMLGEGIQGIPAYLMWNDPVMTYNFVVTLKPWIAALSMYAFAYYWTESAAAALIAGFLFGFHPMRLMDLIHPSVNANEWIPLVLLLLDLLFTRRSWMYAFLLAIVASLQLLESMYVLVPYTFIVGIYGTYLLWRHRRAVPALLPKLLFVAASLAGVAVWVFGPYLETREMWGILQGRHRGAVELPRAYWFGYHRYAGSCLLFLALLGGLDRLLGARTKRGYDPRIPLILAGVAVALFVSAWRIPKIGLVVPSLRPLVGAWIPGLDAIRAPSNMFFGVVIPLALLAAFGVRLLAKRFGTRARGILIGLVAAACAMEVFLPVAAKLSFGRAMPSATFRIRPPQEDIDAVRDLPSGPVLDFPSSYHIFWQGILSRYALLGAYHERRIAACKASFLTPVQFEINRIAGRLPSPDAARELWALGFRTVIFHLQDEERYRRQTDRIAAALADPTRDPHLVPIREGRTVRVFRLGDDVPIATDVRSLSPASRFRLVRLAAGDVGLRFRLESPHATFRHPTPIQPTRFVVTWKHSEEIARSEMVRGLLPLALAGGRTTSVALDAHIPEASGRYEVTLAPADDPDMILALEHVLVKDADG